jgi:hypothetical protein
MRDLCEYCPNVRFFVCGLRLPPTSLTCMGVAWPELTYLTLKECHDYGELFNWRNTRPAWELFFTTCSRKLQKLSVDGGFSSELSGNIAARCSCLLELDVAPYWFKDAALLVLAAGCPLINVLKMQDRHVTDVGLTAIARNGNLVELAMEDCDVTDAGLMELGRYCHDLRILRLIDMNVSGAGLEGVALGCPLLENVMACRNENAGTGAEAVVRLCPRLEYLVLENTRVPVAALRALATCCPLLETLALCCEADALDIIALIRGCPVLTDLIINGARFEGAILRAIQAAAP